VFEVAGEPRRLDRALAEALSCGRRAARALVEAGRVFVDEYRAHAGAHPVAAGSFVRVTPLATAQNAPASPDLVPRVLCSTSDLLVIDKPAGLHTHAGASAASVARWLLAARPEAAAWGANPREAGLVHRLDRDTSGLVVAATDRAIYDALRREFARRRVVKSYLAIVRGRLSRVRTIDRPLVRHKTRVAPARDRDRSLEAATLVEPIENGADWTLVRASMRTGVTHQVRAHLALAGHPILGDAKYGGPPPAPALRQGQLLHALAVTLPDGRSFAAPVPGDFLTVLGRLRRERDA
jgi:23S rRNA pseudouridine1911/1915/1917 synthase